MNDHQAVLLSMLKDVDALCRETGVTYMLFSGTALGAVRHGGFIPWDDDADIVLLRKDYERFLDEAEANLDPKRYFVQREFGPHWPMQFSKIRLNGTACMEKFHPKDRQIHQGVYIDVFPCDDLSDASIVRAIQFIAARIVVAKALDKRGYETDSPIKKLAMIASRLVPGATLRRICTAERPGSRSVHTFFGAGSKYGKNVFPREWFEKTVEMDFEDGRFPVSAHYKELLTTLYGDYMTPPPPEERLCKEHTFLVDLHRPYTDYVDEQTEMSFDVLSRSIR